jgi:hypothetical protein
MASPELRAKMEIEAAGKSAANKANGNDKGFQDFASMFGGGFGDLFGDAMKTKKDWN